ncbi:MAG: ArsR/SmtB family transcription factor [Candidatus Dormibacteraceae bacterium]
MITSGREDARADVWLEQADLSSLPVSTVLDALADPARLEIAHLLAERGEASCTSLGLPLAPSTVTHHLRVLRASGLIATRVKGTARLSHLRTEELERRFPGLLRAVLDAAAPDPS